MSLPVRREPVENRLANGTVLVDRREPGDGVLELRSELATDAVALLGRDGRVAVSVAVTGGRSTTVTGIADGEYQLSYTQGRDWDTGLAAFTRGCQFRRFAEPTTFSTRPVPGGSAFTVRTVTLRDGSNGVETVGVPPTELPR